MSTIRFLIFVLAFTEGVDYSNAQPAPKPLFDDPVSHGGPGRNKEKPAAKNSFDDKCSVIQLAALNYANEKITCDRDEPVIIHLKPNK